MNQFQEYVQKMNEVRASDVPVPSKLDLIKNKIGRALGKNVPDSQVSAEINLVQRLANYYKFNVDTDRNSPIYMAIKQGNDSKLERPEHALLRVARAMLSSKQQLTNYRPTGLTRGDIQAFLEGVGDTKRLDAKDPSAEAMAISLGHLANGMGMSINLDNFFRKQVENYYSNLDRTQRYQDKISKRGISGTAEVLGRQLSRNVRMELKQPLTDIIKKLRDEGDEDNATQVIELYRGLGLSGVV